MVNCSREEIGAAQSREKTMTLELIDKLTGDEGKHYICSVCPIVYEDFEYILKYPRGYGSKWGGGGARNVSSNKILFLCLICLK